MSVVIVEHKCRTCKNFDRCDNECIERVVYLNSLNEYEVISECDFWEEAEKSKDDFLNICRSEEKTK